MVQALQEQQAQPAIDELKLVLTLKGSKGSVGVQKQGCDPYVLVLGEPVTLADLLARASMVYEEAQRRWADQPQYPKYQRPESPPTAKPAGTAQPSVSVNKARADDAPKRLQLL